MADKPPRRWFKFSLRTLFVVITLFAVWLGWEMKFIRARQAMHRWFEDNNWCCEATTDMWDAGIELHATSYSYSDIQNRVAVAIPFWRRWLGDDRYEYILYPRDAQTDDIELAKRLFPEADISEFMICGTPSFQ